MDETNTDMVQLQRDGTGTGLSNIKDFFAECLLLKMSVLQQSMCIFKANLSQVNHMIVGRNIKKMYFMCLIPIQILTQNAIRNSSLHNLKIIHEKGA